MINFEKFTLDNGLKVIFHRDTSTPIAAMNILYNVGARDENPEQTGFAHLFEHLMFGGSKHIPLYDTPLQMVGGENNAFTNSDITNYYLTLPYKNIETGFWLESDRMEELAFTEKSLEVQRNVVIEEFKERCLNQPYGDVSHLLLDLSYKVHPYRWPTIGKDISHIENATLEQVKDFFFKHYAPNNAILCIAGNLELSQVKELSEKWFGSIARRNVPERKLVSEPNQIQQRFLEVERNVPYDAIFMSYHIFDRKNEKYHITDYISDVLSNGKSSRLYQKLVKQKKLFSAIDAYISGTIDAGTMNISGHLIKGVSLNEAQAAIEEELQLISSQNISNYDLSKIKNQSEANFIYSETNILNKAMNLSYFELIGGAELLNSEVDRYRKITADQIRETAAEIFIPENCSILHYKSI